MKTFHTADWQTHTRGESSVATFAKEMLWSL